MSHYRWHRGEELLAWFEKSVRERAKAVNNEKQLNELRDKLTTAFNKIPEVERAIQNTITKNKQAFTAVSSQKQPGSFSLEDKVVIARVGHTLSELGELGHRSAVLALEVGGHERTWQGIGQVSMGAMTIGNGLTLISAASSIFSLATGIGSIGVALGVVCAFKGLFGGGSHSSGPNPFQAIADMLNGLQRFCEREFTELKKIHYQGLAITLEKLQQISRQANRLERITTGGFKELHCKELADIADSIQSEINGEQRLSLEKQQDYLQKLSTWLDIHSKSKIETALISDSDEVEKCVEILGSADFDLGSMFPFFISQLLKIIPLSLLPKVDLHHLPNIEILMQASHIYCIGISRYNLEDNYIPSLQRTEVTFKEIQRILTLLKDNSEIWDRLFRQHEELRFHVGQAIAKCIQELGNKAPLDVPLSHLFKIGENRENLFHKLTQLEFIRLILKNMITLLEPNSPHILRFKKLDSKDTILNRTKAEVDQATQDLIIHAQRGHLEGLQLALYQGANINKYARATPIKSKARIRCWGQAIHYIGRQEPYENHQWNEVVPVEMLHQLFKSGKDLECLSCTKFESMEWREKWNLRDFIHSKTMLDFALLYAAAGYDTKDLFDNDKARNNQWDAVVLKYLIQDINEHTGMLNATELKKAYQFYRAVEAGSPILPADVNHDCLLWIVVLLGDLKPLQILDNFHGDVNKAIPIVNFTPLMMAVYVGQPAVIDYLLEKKANLQANFTTTDPDPAFNVVPKGRRLRARGEPLNETSHLLFIALSRKNYYTAKKLCDAGIQANDAQKALIGEKTGGGFMFGFFSLSRAVIELRDAKESSSSLQKNIPQIIFSPLFAQIKDTMEELTMTINTLLAKKPLQPKPMIQPKESEIVSAEKGESELRTIILQQQTQIKDLTKKMDMLTQMMQQLLLRSENSEEKSNKNYKVTFL